ncbi:AAA family ATPase [Paramagnetospirillum kuznetsovii]|nr:ATP-binding protein [Paramagnetospirillum kuznetsovii]
MSNMISEAPKAKLKMVLMRGLAGSGKSTLAQILASRNDGRVISADDFFVGSDGVYRHDHTKIRIAHVDARQRIESAVKSGCDYIVVDNTHITHRDMEEYFRLAASLNALVELIEPTTPWAKDPDECVKRTVHNVPLDIIKGMLNRYQSMETDEAQMIVAGMRTA